MSEFIIAEKSQLVDIADAIRTKTETTDTLSLEEMPQMIADIETGANLEEITVEQVTPSISVSSAGLITASATQTEGYVVAGTKSATKQLTTQAAKTITPSSSVQTAVAAGTYTTGAIKVAAIPNSYANLNFCVVGGTSQPSNPATNTIWINTSTNISSWVFSAEKPTSPTAGLVWFSTNDSFPMQTFNALKANNITIYLTGCQQYVSGAWVNCTAKIYNGTSWVLLWNGELYYLGNEFENVTGGWQAVGLAYQYYDGSWKNGNKAGAPTLVKNANSFTVTQPGETSGVIRIIDDIDLTDYDTVMFEMEGGIIPYCAGSIVVYKSDIARFEYTSGVTDYNNVGVYRTFKNGYNSVTLPRARYSVSVAELEGNYTIGFHLNNSNSYNMSVTIHSVTLKSQNGTTGWDGTLFANGNQYVDVTGGWIESNQRYNADQGNAVVIINQLSDGQLEFSTTVSGTDGIKTANMIDLTHYKQVTLVGKLNTAQAGSYLYITQKPYGNYSDSNTAPATVALNTTGAAITLDVSSFSGEYYICIGLNGLRTYTMTSCKIS